MSLTDQGCPVSCDRQQVIHDEQEDGVAEDEGHLERGSVHTLRRQQEADEIHSDEKATGDQQVHHIKDWSAAQDQLQMIHRKDTAIVYVYCAHLYYTALYFTTLCYILLNFIHNAILYIDHTECHAKLHYTILCYNILNYTMLYSANVLFYSTQRYSMLRYTTLNHSKLCHTTP